MTEEERKIRDTLETLYGLLCNSTISASTRDYYMCTLNGIKTKFTSEIGARVLRENK